MPKAADLINYRLKIIVSDGRYLIGQMLAYDKHMNLVLGECEEYRRVKRKAKDGAKAETLSEEKRSLGLVILRGDTIVSMTIEAPPPPTSEAKAKLSAQVNSQATSNIGVVKPMGRGAPIVPPSGLAGPVRGVGGPAPQAMIPGMVGRMPMGVPPPPMPFSMPGGPPRPPPGMPNMFPPPGFVPPPGMPNMFPPGFVPPSGMGLPPGMPPQNTRGPPHQPPPPARK